MLVLSRKTNEAIHIGSDIVVKVVLIRGDTVRIGIEAPPDIPIRRREIAFETTTPPDSGKVQAAA